MMSKPYAVRLEDVVEASKRIAGHVHTTPVHTSRSIDEMASCSLGQAVHIIFKCENLQKTGSFKARGACNAVMHLRGGAQAVCTHSSGNHAAALAWAANVGGLAAHIVMPRGAPASKVRAVNGYGATVIECEPTQKAREEAASFVALDTGAAFVHPSEDPLVIAGQGTMALELLDQARARHGTGEAEPALDVIVVPVGGGGMISGVATAVKGIDPRIKVVGAEPAAADDAYRSKCTGSLQGNAVPPCTIADGLKTTLGPNTWPIVRDKVDAICTVTDDEIRQAVALTYSRLKMVIEPSAGVGTAAVLFSRAFQELIGELSTPLDRPLRVAVVLCGGNLDLDLLPQYLLLSHA